MPEHVTKEVCEIKSDHFEKTLMRIEESISKAVVLMEKNDEHHRHIQSKLFDRIDDAKQRITQTETKQKNVNKQMWVISSAIIGAVVKIIFF